MSDFNFDPVVIADFLARWILGLNFFISGLNGFRHWFPLPEPKPEMGRFVEALNETGYLMEIVKTLEIVAGLCLLAGFFVPLALVTLGPIVFVVVSSQLMLNRERGWGISALILVPFLILLGTRWDYFEPFFRL